METSAASQEASHPIAPLLELRDVHVQFPGRRRHWLRPEVVRAVNGVSFQLAPGETLGIVGESGCGKSTMARAIVNLVRVTAGQVLFRGQRIDHLDDTRWLPFRRKIQMVFQDPFASLNPRMTIGDTISEPMAILGLHSARDRQRETMRLMDLVGLNPRFLNRYPHEFSGGQRQRVGIARALAVQPEVIVCDEPVSALDVSIQAQVVNLLAELQEKLHLSYVFIAHDLAIVRHLAHRVGVMYLGKVVELAEAAELYANPRHPYTEALLSAGPIPDPELESKRQRVRLVGEVPTADREYSGCAFADRCPIAESACRQTPPRLSEGPHQVACGVRDRLTAVS